MLYGMCMHLSLDQPCRNYSAQVLSNMLFLVLAYKCSIYFVIVYLVLRSILHALFMSFFLNPTNKMIFSLELRWFFVFLAISSSPKHDIAILSLFNGRSLSLHGIFSILFCYKFCRDNVMWNINESNWISFFADNLFISLAVWLLFDECVQRVNVQYEIHENS